MDQIKEEVADQVDKIRSAATSSSDPIHEFMQRQQQAQEAAAEAPATTDLKSFAEQAQAAADKVASAADQAQSTVDATAQDIADRAQSAFDEASK